MFLAHNKSAKICLSVFVCPCLTRWIIQKLL